MGGEDSSARKHVRRRRAGPSAAVALLVLVAVTLAAGTDARANWLTRLTRVAGEAGEAGAKVASHGIAALDRAALYVKSIPPGKAGSAALAAHATQEGHWKFVNKSGEVFTAGTPEELARAIPTLAPEVALGKAKPALYLSESTVFEQRTLLKDLPKNAELHVVVGNEGFALVRRVDSGSERLLAEVRPNIVVELTEKRAFDEAVWQLQRSLNKASVRVLSLEPGGPKTLKPVPRYDAQTRAALVDAIEPTRLTRAFPALRGQTVVIVGRSEGELLRFQPASGPENSVFLSELKTAAERADINLVILESPTPRQPGGRNWLWQRIEVGGLDEAMKRATFADFLNALGAARGQLTVRAHPEASGRVLVTTELSGAAARPLTGGFTDWLGDMTAGVAGRVLVHGALAFMRSEERERELDARIVPGIPTYVQIPYLVGLVSGLFGWPVASGWWRHLWPSERPVEYSGRVGYNLARGARLAVFLLLFLPLAGFPALMATLAGQVWEMMTAPFRLLRWLAGKLRRQGQV